MVQAIRLEIRWCVKTLNKEDCIRKHTPREIEKKLKQQRKDYYWRNRDRAIVRAKEWYRENRDRVRENARNRYNRARQFIVAYKLAHPCSRCGESDPRCLDFHHINPDEKVKPVSKLAANSPLSVVKEEMEKCEVICANCHRKETLPEETTQASHYAK